MHDRTTASAQVTAPPTSSRSRIWNDLVPLSLLALTTLVIHAATGNRYGFHRDELATLDDARHLAWGYVAYPPVTPFFGRLALILFGESLAGFRFFAALAEAVAVVLAGLMAREMGGRRFAQLLACAAAVPFCLIGGALMQYVSFDYLFWVLTAYFVVRLLKSDDPRWWIPIAAAVGLGLMAKYTILLFALSLIVGMSLTSARRHLASRWLWYGVALATAIVLPNIVWQARHGFVTLDFLHHIHARDVRIGRTKDFLPDQLKLTLLSTPLWIAGLAFLFSGAGRRFRPIAWMYVLPLVLFVLMKGRGYYLAAAYPMLYAAGAVFAESWFASMRPALALTLRIVACIALLVDIAVAGFAGLPLARVNSAWARAAFKVNGDMREEIGWPELVETVARIRDALPAADRNHLGILAGNYGEAGAVALYGPRFGLPTPISGVNSFWDRGYGEPPPTTLIVIGLSRSKLDEVFATCQLAAHSWNKEQVENEETVHHPDIFVCRILLHPWPEFWKHFRYYG